MQPMIAEGALRQNVVDATVDLRAEGVPYVAERFALNPAVLPRSTGWAVEAAAQAVFDGLDLLLAGYFAGDVRRMADFLGFRRDEADLFVRMPGEDWAAVAR